MDRATWLRCLALPPRLRARWVREQLTSGSVSRELTDFAERLAREPVPGAGRIPTAEELDARCALYGVRWFTPLDPTYPRHALEGLHDPPAVLFVRGDVTVLAPSSRVAVVGARHGTARGRRVASRLGVDCARAGIAVVSGLALGIDAAAHEGCLEAGGRAVVVLPRGLDVAYPVRHARLYQRLLARGVAVSEYAPGEPARKERFVARNRLVAALADAVVVVEAGQRSGALHTVEFAQQLGRDVMAVPGPVDCPHAVGTLALLRDGAVLVRDGRDLLDSLGREPLPASAAPLGLTQRPEPVMEIARRLGWPLTRTLAALGEAELLGLVERAGGDRWMAASSLPVTGEHP